MSKLDFVIILVQTSDTVCFLDSWPQTKGRVTFETCFWHSFYALSHGTLGFALHGSSYNHFLIGGDSSTANQIL